VNCVVEQRKPLVTATDGYNALRLVLLLRDKILKTMPVK
jgi:hypothetical protein